MIPLSWRQARFGWYLIYLGYWTFPGMRRHVLRRPGCRPGWIRPPILAALAFIWLLDGPWLLALVAAGARWLVRHCL